MKLVNSNWEHSIDLTDGSSCLLIIENSIILRDYLIDLSKAIETDESAFVLSDENDYCKINEHFVIISDPLFLNISDKRIQTRITKLMQEHIVSSDHYSKTSKILADLETYAQVLEEDFPFSVEHKVIEYSDLIKLLGFSPMIEYETNIDKLLEYTNIMHDICSINCFVFVGLSMFFKESTINTFLHECSLNKHNVILIERSTIYKNLQTSQKIIIDSDSCEIF